MKFSVVLLSAALLAAAGCRVEQDEYPQVNLPAPPPPSSGSDSTGIPADTAHWRNFSLRTRSFTAPAPSVFEIDSEGVKSYSDVAQFGSLLSTARNYDLDNRTIRLLWRCFDGGSASGFAIAVADTSGLIYDGANTSRFRDLNALYTRTAYAGSSLILNNAWYYSTLTTAGGQYTLTTAAGDFAENGGFQVDRKTGTLPFARGRILLRSEAPRSAGCMLVVNRLTLH